MTNKRDKEILKLIKDTNSDDVILNDVAETVNADLWIDKAEDLGLQLFDTVKGNFSDNKLFNTKQENNPQKPANENPTTIIPTLNAEKLESGLRQSKENTAINTVMRPDIKPAVKESKLFDGLRFSTDIETFEVDKKIDKSSTVGIYTNTFDKTFGVNYKTQKSGNLMSIKVGAEYNIDEKGGKLAANYFTKRMNVGAKLYINEENSGVNLSYKQKMFNKGVFSTSVSIFQNDIATSIDYKKPINDGTTLKVGAYASTMNKEIGFSARLGF